MAKNTLEMTHEEWLSERTKGIGGSDAATVLGLNKYKTPFELWLEKTGQSDVQEPEAEAAYFGNVLEDLVAKEFERRSGKKVRRNNFMMQHPDHDFILANIDRKIVSEQALLECKTASAFLQKDWENDEIPESYLVQIQHYLGVTGYEKAYVAVLIGGQRFVWKEIERDDELIQMIFHAEVHFWNHHVLKNNPPVLDGSSAAEKFLNERYKKSDSAKTVDLSYEYSEKIQHLNEIKESIKQLNEQKKQIENLIKNELQEAEQGFVKNYQVTWKAIKQNRVDTNKLKESFPDVYQKVRKEVSQRRLNVKEIS
ncbi:YqaJ viral recombinase family nuclease [Gracilibacillus sp. D59]|uniref:YqaJ viral recombinase family nuclease n=1 Tax=Gracilibacillus sp. D59 TaxID=3457434 RepID=UPI003FCDF018